MPITTALSPASTMSIISTWASAIRPPWAEQGQVHSAVLRAPERAAVWRKRLAQHHGGGLGDIERAHARPHGDQQPGIGRVMHLPRAPRRFPAPPAACRRGEGEAGIGLGRLGGQQHQPSRPPFGPEPLPGGMPASGPGLVQIIHPGPAEIAVAEQKSTGLDDIHRHPQAGTKPHQAAPHSAECRADRAPGASNIAPHWPQGTGRKGIFCVIVPQDPRNSTLYFTARNGKRAGDSRGRRVTASIPSPRSNVARFAVLFGFSKGDPVTATTQTRARGATFFMWRRARWARWASPPRRGPSSTR